MGHRRDTRNTSRRPTGEQYVLNMTGYAVAYRQHTGSVETDTVLDYLVATKAPYYLPVASEGPVSDRLITRFANEERPGHAPWMGCGCGHNSEAPRRCRAAIPSHME